jgi:hypothetical protein
MQEGKVILACSLVVLVMLSGFGAANWSSKVGDWESRFSIGSAFHLILSYHIYSADNSNWTLAKELIENDDYLGAITELSWAENNLTSFFDNVQYAKAFTLLEDESVYDNMAQLAQNLIDHIGSLIENLQVGEVQQSSVNLIDNEFESLWNLYQDTFEQEGWQAYRDALVKLVTAAGQTIDTKAFSTIQYVKSKVQ